MKFSRFKELLIRGGYSDDALRIIFWNIRQIESITREELGLSTEEIRSRYREYTLERFNHTFDTLYIRIEDALEAEVDGVFILGAGDDGNSIVFSTSG